MAQEIDLGGTIYISSKRAAEITGYTQDYVGQLARGGHIVAQRVSGLWYVVEESLRNYKSKADEFKPVPPPILNREPVLDSSVSFDGKDYVSAQRAAELTGYHQDYVSQLARNGKVLSRHVGNRWFVDREAIVEHKRHNDALLAAVQAESVGLMRQAPFEPSTNDQTLHFTYNQHTHSEEMPLPTIQTQEDKGQNYVDALDRLIDEPATEIPIRVIRPATIARQPEPEARFRKSIVNYRRSRLVTFIVIGSISALVVAVGGYVYTFNTSLLVHGYNATSNIVQAAATGIPIDRYVEQVQVPAFLQQILANELYFRRDSF